MMKKKFPLSTWLLFIVPSLLGITLFMIPMKFSDGSTSIPVAHFADLLMNVIQSYMPLIGTIVMTISAIIGIFFLIRSGKPTKYKTLNSLFNVTPFWVGTRILAAVFAFLVFFKIGPEAIWSGDTGGLLLSKEGLVTMLFTVFLFAGFLLPLLLNFGLLEFFGTLMVKIMRPLFKLPGRSSVDALTSWIGDGTIGVLLTSRQYEEGHYTQKEAAIIGTTFSVVSITFTIVILKTVGLEDYFLPFYGTVALIGFILAFIMPRIYPLAQKKDVYIDGSKPTKDAESIPEGYTAFTLGTERALEKAEQNRSISRFIGDGTKNVLDMWFGVIPVVMAFGTTALIIAEYTPVFTILGKPFEPLLALLQIPQAAEAGQLMVVGFADMFLPAILAAGFITEPITLFVVAVIAVTQLIFMAEVGGLLLGSKIPVNFWELVVIFVIRTLVALPIAAGIAHLLF